MTRTYKVLDREVHLHIYKIMKECYNVDINKENQTMFMIKV